MSNRYFTMGSDGVNYYTSKLPTILSVMKRGSHHPNKRDDEPIADETKIPKRIFGNNMFKEKLRLMQDVKNFQMEKHRLKGYIKSKSPAVREHIIDSRIRDLKDKIREAEPYLRDIEK